MYTFSPSPALLILLLLVSSLLILYTPGTFTQGVYHCSPLCFWSFIAGLILVISLLVFLLQFLPYLVLSLLVILSFLSTSFTLGTSSTDFSLLVLSILVLHSCSFLSWFFSTVPFTPVPVCTSSHLHGPSSSLLSILVFLFLFLHLYFFHSCSFHSCFLLFWFVHAWSFLSWFLQSCSFSPCSYTFIPFSPGYVSPVPFPAGFVSPNPFSPGYLHSAFRSLFIRLLLHPSYGLS